MSTSSQDGFSLLELLVVLALLALCLAVTLPYMQPKPRGVDLQALTQEIVANLRLARGRSLRLSTDETFMLDVKERSFWIDGLAQQRLIPAQFSVELETAALEGQPDRGAIRFFFDGSSSGGRIRLQWGEQRTAIRVDWLSGAIHVERYANSAKP